MNERSKIFSVTITPRGIDFLIGNCLDKLQNGRSNFYHAYQLPARAVER